MTASSTYLLSQLNYTISTRGSTRLLPQMWARPSWTPSCISYRRKSSRWPSSKDGRTSSYGTLSSRTTFCSRGRGWTPGRWEYVCTFKLLYSNQSQTSSVTYLRWSFLYIYSLTSPHLPTPVPSVSIRRKLGKNQEWSTFIFSFYSLSLLTSAFSSFSLFSSY